MSGWMSSFADPADEFNQLGLGQKEQNTPFFKGIGTAAKQGVMRGGTALARGLQLGVSTFPLAEDLIRGDENQARYNQYMGWTESTLQSAEQYWKMPEDVGTGSQIVGGLGRIVLPLAVGGGNPTALIGSETTIGAQDALEYGANSDQAIGIGIAQGTMAGIGAMLPAAIGKSVVTKVASGAALNVGLGLGLRATQSAIAGDNKELAKIYDPFDPTYMATDATIGAAFGAVAALATRRQAMPIHQQDAIADAEINSQVNEAAWGAPVGANAANLHRQNLSSAEQAIKTNQSVKTVLPEAGAKRVSLTPTKGHAPQIAQAAEAAGMDVPRMLAIAHFETGGKFNPDADNPASSAHGLGQITKGTWDHYGGGDRNDPAEQIRMFLKIHADYSAKAKAVLGHDPSPAHDYMIWQWGPTGFKNMMAADRGVLVEKIIGKKAAADNGFTGKTVGQAIASLDRRIGKLYEAYSGEAYGGTAYTAAGDPVQFVYDVVPAGELLTSHNNDLSVNDRFPAELQPRDRSRAASMMQINAMVDSMNPHLLGDSPTVTDGAPIVGFDSVVESGNARSIAIRRGYEGGKAESYRQYLNDNAERFGISREALDSMDSPVLVRRRISDVDRAEFARRANESTIAAMSSSERTAGDLTRLPPADLLNVSDDGRLNIATSHDYVRQFIQNMPENERATMMTADGRLSQEGKRRIEGAIMQEAYGDAALVERLGESLDDNSKSVLNALLRNAGSLAKLSALVKQGGRESNTIAADLAQAAGKFSDIKAAGQTVADYMAQGQLVDDGLSIGAREALQVFGDNSRSTRAVSDYIQSKINEVEAKGDPRQGGLFDDQQVAEIVSVHDRIVEQLKNTGRYNDQYIQDAAQIASAAYSATAREMGISATELFDRYPLRIENGQPGAKDGAYQQVESAKDAVNTLLKLTRTEDAFQYPKSTANDLGAILADMGWKVESGKTIKDEAGDLTYTTVSNNGQEAMVFERGGDVWLDMSDLDGGGKGSAVYTAVADYAFNNGKVMVGDPKGLSVDGYYRTIKLMLSSALRHQTTRHLMPDQRLIDPGKMSESLPLEARPIDWQSGNDAHNIKELLEASQHNIFSAYPALKDFTYDFARKDFIDRRSNEVATDRVLEAMVRPESGANRTVPAGVSTAKRAILGQAISSAESGSPRGDLLGEAGISSTGRSGVDHTPATGLDAALEGIFYQTSGDLTTTANFKNWFGDSKVVDGSGKPLVMYHGTNKTNADGTDFTMFDTYATAHGLMGQGSYFTDNNSVAQSYTAKGKGSSPRVYETYLSIKNPLDMDAAANPAQWRSQFDEVAENGYFDNMKKNTNEAYYRQAEEYYADEQFYRDEAAEILVNGIEAMGHDGVTHIGGGRVKADSVNHRVYIAFHPEQVKSIHNNGDFNPSNVDIFYQGKTSAIKSLDDWKQSAKDQDIVVSAHESGDVITLNKMVVPESGRGKGTGSAVMQALVDYADANGKHIALTPSKEFGGSVPRLKEFYKRFGFVENKGGNKVFQTSETMYRQVAGKTLHQGNARGQIEFSPGKNGSTITLGENADFSTFVHELGHHFVEMHMTLAKTGELSPALVADMDTVMTWAGHDNVPYQQLTPEQRTALHEQFAETFEQYLASGKAPTPELKGVFDRFKSWMVDAYKSLQALVSGTPNARLSPEIVGVMDRMLGARDTDSATVVPESNQGVEGGLFNETPEQVAALATLGEQDILIPSGLDDADGNPIMLSGREMLEQLKADKLDSEEQAKATEAAISCALGNGV